MGLCSGGCVTCSSHYSIGCCQLAATATTATSTAAASRSTSHRSSQRAISSSSRVSRCRCSKTGTAGSYCRRAAFSVPGALGDGLFSSWPSPRCSTCTDCNRAESNTNADSNHSKKWSSQGGAPSTTSGCSSAATTSSPSTTNPDGLGWNGKATAHGRRQASWEHSLGLLKLTASVL